MKRKTENTVPRPPKSEKAYISPCNEAFLPLLLSATSATLALIMLIIDKFIHPFGGDLLSPMLGQMIILFIPTYICIHVSSYRKSAKKQLKWLGLGKMGAEHIFF